MQRSRSPPFTYLSLPAEIRNQIYKLCLVSHKLIVVSLATATSNHAASSLSPKVHNEAGLCPAILSTCRQIYNEANDTLYSDNTFYWRYNGRRGLVEALLAQTSVTNRLQLRSLGVDAHTLSELTRACWNDGLSTALQGLTKLVVYDTIEQYGTTVNCMQDIDVCMKNIGRVCQKLDVVSREREMCGDVGNMLPHSKDIEFRAYEAAS